jgi:hypothetical protein
MSSIGTGNMARVIGALAQLMSRSVGLVAPVIY